MEIKINSLEDIHNAAKAFISNMGDSKVFAFYGRWELAKLPSSRHCVKN